MPERQSYSTGRSPFQNLPFFEIDKAGYEVCRVDESLDAGTNARVRHVPFSSSGKPGNLKSVATQKVTNKTPLINKSKPSPRNGRLTVTQGQITFDAEGNDSPASSYFSRQIHWPGNTQSGVTLGRGYDMGNRTKQAVKQNLVDAGMVVAIAEQFAAGAGQKGSAARKFVDENRDKLGVISHEIQQQLFNNIYPEYVTRARENYIHWTKHETDKVNWDRLEPAIRDVLVDFVYQGFTKGPNPMKKGMRNDLDELIAYVETNPTIQQYEAGRNRAGYLRAAKTVE